MPRSGEIILLKNVNKNSKDKISELENKHGNHSELRIYNNGCIGGYFGTKNVFRFIGKEKEIQNNNLQMQKYYKRNNMSGGYKKKKVSLKSAVNLLREYYSEQYGTH